MNAKGGLDINSGNVSDSIDPFFTKEELEKMSDYERNHLQNLRSNYEALLLIGKKLILMHSEVLTEKYCDYLMAYFDERLQLCCSNYNELLS